MPQTSNLQLAYSSMMSKIAVQKRPITVQFEGSATSFGRGGASPSLVTSLSGSSLFSAKRVCLKRLLFFRFNKIVYIHLS